GAAGADAGLAGLVAVAQVGVGARRAVGDCDVAAAGRGHARVGGADVVVVAVGGGPGGADPGRTALGAVALVAVAARRAVDDGGVPATEDRIARIGGARVRVVAVEGGAGDTRAALARLRAV